LSDGVLNPSAGEVAVTKQKKCCPSLLGVLLRKKSILGVPNGIATRALTIHWGLPDVSTALVQERVYLRLVLRTNGYN
jgi:hypothetical protein